MDIYSFPFPPVLPPPTILRVDRVGQIWRAGSCLLAWSAWRADALTSVLRCLYYNTAPAAIAEAKKVIFSARSRTSSPCALSEGVYTRAFH